MTVTDLGEDRVGIEGATGRPRTDTLKVSVGHFDGWIGEGSISYGGLGALARARLAAAIVAERIALIGLTLRVVRYDIIGVDSLLAVEPRGAGATAMAVPADGVGSTGATDTPAAEPREVRLRVAARTASATEAQRLAREVEALYTNGPAGGGGATTAVRQVLAMRATLMPRHLVTWRVHYERVS